MAGEAARAASALAQTTKKVHEMFRAPWHL